MKRGNFIIELNKPWEDEAYGYETFSKGDIIYNTLRYIIDNEDKSEWAYKAFEACADLLIRRRRWPDEDNHERDAGNRLRWWWSRTLYKLKITKNVMYGPQSRMSRDPFVYLYCAAVFLEREQFIKAITIPWHINRPDIWIWRRRLIKDNRKEFVRRLDYYKSLAYTMNYERHHLDRDKVMEVLDKIRTPLSARNRKEVMEWRGELADAICSLAVPTITEGEIVDCFAEWSNNEGLTSAQEWVVEEDYPKIAKAIYKQLTKEE